MAEDPKDLPDLDANDPEPPARREDGKDNPEHIKWQARIYSRLMTDVALGKRDAPRGLNPSQMQDFLVTRCKLAGYDPRQLMDQRTDAQINEDTARILIQNPESGPEMEGLEKLDSLLEEIEVQMNRADLLCGEIVGVPGTHKHDMLLGTKAQREALRQNAKKWRSRIGKILRLRERAAKPIQKGDPSRSRRALEMAHPLRYMVWIGRPGGSNEKCFQISHHHAKMADTLYQAVKGERFSKDSGNWVKKPASGVAYVIPPGHNKTTFVAHVMSLWISKNPRLRCMFVHSQEEKAHQNNEYVQANFNPAHASGRRNLILFPGLKIKEQSKRQFRLDLGERQRAPTIRAHGIYAAASGDDVDVLWFDDPCDQKLAEQPAERERIWDRMNGTWRSRKRHGWSFEFISTTLWHHDDPNARTIQLIRDGKIDRILCRLVCGGPKDNFKALWDYGYPPQRLREIYAEMRNPRLYAAAYEGNPQPDEFRTIKALAHYDQTAEEHRGFLSSAVFHLSLDPAATKHNKSDKAAWVYAAVGDEITREASGALARRRVMRILDAVQFHATPTDAVYETTRMCSASSVHYVHVEAVSAFVSIVEMLQALGIDVISHTTGNRPKGLRLKDVASMLDESLKDKNLPGSVVQFPVDGSLKWLEEQILDFGVASEDHAVDALTQLCKHQMGNLDVGEGAATIASVKALRAGADPKLAAFFDEIDKRRFGVGEDEEHRFLSSLHRGLQ